MRDESEHRLIYFEGEEPLVRRLGAALVSQWNDIPQDVQDSLIERAILVMDEDQSEHLAEQLRRFIATHTQRG